MVELGHMVGPFREILRVLQFGMFPMKETGKFHLNNHLSFPPGALVNDGIAKEDVAVSYTSFERAVLLAHWGDPGAL